uniref:Retinoic acid receptor responder protein 2 n=1 Tax=Kryptolebias marmoratus TaxID=37003 RepID=A0A3Q3BCS8_KRYMA
MAALLLWLLSAAALLSSSDATREYDSLPETYKKGVDLAMEKVNSHPDIQLHFLFFQSVEKSTFEPGFDVSYINHHFYLKATRCQKGTVDASGCQFRRDRALIDCMVCYKTYRGEIEQEPEPFTHCIHKPALTEEMKTTRDEKCKAVGYNSGSITLLSSTGNQ